MSIGIRFSPPVKERAAHGGEEMKDRGDPKGRRGHLHQDRAVRREAKDAAEGNGEATPRPLPLLTGLKPRVRCPPVSTGRAPTTLGCNPCAGGESPSERAGGV